MTFPVVGSNIPSSYQISNSLRFNDGDSPRLDRTNVASPTNSKKYTYSVWIKRSAFSDGNNRQILSAINGNNRTQILFRSGSNEAIRVLSTTDAFSTFKYLITTNALYRDASAWYHVVCVFDSTDATANDRFKIYVNGVEQSLSISTSVASNYDDPINSGSVAQDLGHADGSEIFDGYFAEAHFIDGTAKSPTDFGEFDEDSGVWKPKQYAGTYGTNGFYLKFNNTGNMGEDSSGNDNTWTPTNLSGTTDVTTDTPTNNFATVNALANYYNPATLSEGNLRVDFASGVDTVFNISTMGASTGKWYCEIKAVTIPDYAKIGIASRPCIAGGNSDNLSAGQYNYGYSASNGNVDSNNTAGGDGGTYIGYGATWDDGDIIGIGLDLDNNRLYFSKNGTWQNSADPSAGTGGVVIADPTLTQDGVYYFGVGDNRNDHATRMDCNFGNAPYTISSGNSDDNGYGNFEYAPPTGYLALCTKNLSTEAAPTIDDGSDYMNTILYTGTGSTLSLTGVGFQPDWVWGKCRSAAQTHRLFDSSRGVLKNIISASNNAEATTANSLTSFDSDGFTLGTDDNLNFNTRNFVAWNWKANGGTTSTNTDGSQNSTVQVNSTAGFSIVKRTGTGSAGATYGHGLGVEPEVIINKGLNTNEWYSYFKAIGGGSHWIDLSGTGAAVSDANMWNNTDATSSVFTVGNSGGSNGSGVEYIAYCFHSVEGYSKFGSYTGNGSTDGTFIYTGFRPAFVIVKRTDTAKNWYMFDSVRNTFNVIDDLLAPNLSDAESSGTGTYIDFLSNGFKLRQDFSHLNASGSTQIYMAFAENPFVTSGAVPVTAR